MPLWAHQQPRGLIPAWLNCDPRGLTEEGLYLPKSACKAWKSLFASSNTQTPIQSYANRKYDTIKETNNASVTDMKEVEIYKLPNK